ncbi:MAG TPA: hypothetical protein VFW12_01600 [Candidatus Limnocylindria bacterium]|nr:hypothetical protein [Candidatus Limnocylindria bacterium]
MRLDRDERGQAHILLVVALAIGVIVLVGLLVRQEELIGTARAARAGEAAAQAAGAVVADEHLALVMSVRDGGGGPRDPTRDELLVFLADVGLRERALAAARSVAAEHGITRPWRVSIVDRGREIEVSVDNGLIHRVTIEKVSCCRR